MNCFYYCTAIQDKHFIHILKNSVSLFGIRGKAEVGIGNSPIKIGRAKAEITIIGIEDNFRMDINKGFTWNVKGKGVIADFVKTDQSL